MIERLAGQLVDRLAEKQVIKSTETEIYQYGYAIVFSKSVSLVFTLMIGLAFEALPECLIFLLFFRFLRKYAGGIHAGSREVCILVSAGLVFGVNLLLLFPVPQEAVVGGLILEGIAALYIWKTAPVESENKRLDEEEQSLYRFRCKVVLSIEIFLLLLFLAVGLGKLAEIMVIVHSICAGAMLWGRRK